MLLLSLLASLGAAHSLLHDVFGESLVGNADAASSSAFIFLSEPLNQSVDLAEHSIKSTSADLVTLINATDVAYVATDVSNVMVDSKSAFSLTESLGEVSEPFAFVSRDSATESDDVVDLRTFKYYQRRRKRSTSDCPEEWLNPRDRFAHPGGKYMA